MHRFNNIGLGFFFGLFILITELLIFQPMHAEAGDVKRVGILLFGAENRYAAQGKGAVEQLAIEGFSEPAVEIFMENAGGSKAKAAELARKLADGKLDLIFAFGTSAALAVANEIKDVPLVCGAYDPVASGLALEWTSSGNNTTGVSPIFPLANLVRMLQEMVPVKKMGVLYTPHEKNSEAQLTDLTGLQDEYRIKIIPVPLTREEEISELLPQVLRVVDAIFLTGSGIVGKNLATIVDAATKAKVVTVTHLDDLAEQGALLGMAANQYKMGRLAGEKGAKILRGAKPSEIPYETLPLSQLDLILNMKTAKAGGFQFSPAFMKSVTRVIE